VLNARQIIGSTDRTLSKKLFVALRHDILGQTSALMRALDAPRTPESQPISVQRKDTMVIVHTPQNPPNASQGTDTILALTSVLQRQIPPSDTSWL
jgi:hypothetical protein